MMKNTGNIILQYAVGSIHLRWVTQSSVKVSTYENTEVSALNIE